MQLDRPEVQRVHVTVYDRSAKESKTLTIYGASVGSVVEQIKSAIKGSEDKPRRRKTRAA